MIFALVGCVLLFIGVFMPIVRLPVVGSINYFQSGKGDGVLLILLAVVASVLILKGQLKWVWATGAAALAILIFTFVKLLRTLSAARQQVARDLADNPFRGLGEMALESVQLEWGWAILVIGSLLLVGSGVRAWAEDKQGADLPLATLFQIARPGVLAIGAVLLIVSLSILVVFSGGNKYVKVGEGTYTLYATLWNAGASIILIVALLLMTFAFMKKKKIGDPE